MLHRLGRDATWVIYQARHNQTGRIVVLIVIDDGWAIPRTAIEHNMNEVVPMAKLKYPHIGEFLEQGTTSGEMWFAMEYVP